MNKEVQYKKFFQLTSRVTDTFPQNGAHALNILFKLLLANKMIIKSLSWSTRQRLNKIKKFDRFLVTADLNFGDAVIASCGVAALREIFPGAEIDFVIKKEMKNIFNGSPDISNLYALYNGSPFPSESDSIKLINIANSKDYDLIINFSPMIEDRIFGNNNVINYHLLAAQLVKNESIPNAVNNITYLAYNFIGKIFCDYIPAGFGSRFRGSKIFLSDEAMDAAYNFLISRGVSTEDPVILFNPDTSGRFTRIPFQVQVDLLKRLSVLPCQILLGAGYTEKNIELELLGSLPEQYRQKIIMVPHAMKIEEFTALIDFADIFITGDTGPLHLAASRRYLQSTGKSIRNKTAVFSVFGGTPPKVYGFDSKAAGFFPANQDAPSRAFIAPSPCRNITCINKSAKTCREVRCFHLLGAEEIISESASYLDTLKNSVHIKRDVSA